MALSPELVEDRLIVRYLLGLLSDADAEPLDEAGVVNADFALRLRSVEDDLVDSYVSQALDAATSARFEEFYLSSPRRRERVAFARRFLTTIDSSMVPVNASSRTGRASHVRPATRESASLEPRPTARATRLRWLTVAALVVMTCGGLATSVLLWPEAHHASSVAATRPMVPILARPDAAVSSVPQQSDGLTLSPQTRGAEPLPIFEMTPNADHVVFRLRLDLQEYDRYAVSLADTSTRRHRWHDEVMPERAARPPVLVLTLPADVLHAGPHTFEVSGRDARGRSEPVATYAFAIRRH